MNVLVIGSGGREHALAWKAAQSPDADTVFVAPGNAGTACEPGVENVNIDVLDLEGLAKFAAENNVGLTIVGPEAPLVAGIVDLFEERGLRVFGPSAGAAQLEGSKAFTKDFLARQKIPSAAYGNFTDVDKALSYVREQGAPIVVKADGLAAGKGVIVAMTLEEAENAVRCMIDGEHVLPLATSQDHKRVGDGDTGPNTGGMGAYSPAPVVTAEVHKRIMDEVIYPTVRGMAAEGHPYKGFLYAGLMIDTAGAPKVIEFNCRFGDPETQPILLRMKSDIVELCQAAIDAKLDQCSSDWDERAAVGIVLAAGGYPGSYNKGDAIFGLPETETEGEKAFHAGTALSDSQVVTSGGRVLCATALGNTVTEAQQRAYKLAEKISWDGAFYRNDIAYRAIAREKS